MERISYQDIPQGMFEKLREIEDFIANSSLDKKLVEIIKLRVSQINECAYCVDMHHKELKHLGETDLRLSSICVWEEATYFSTKEQAALEFAERLTLLSREGVSERIFDELSMHFNKEEISYLSLAVTQINTWNRLMRTFKFTPGNYRVEE